METKWFDNLPITNEEIVILKNIDRQISNSPKLIPYILMVVSEYQFAFMSKCRQANDRVMREALGDALLLFSQKEQLDKKDLKQFCGRIKNAIFKEGINEYHHQGERNFFEMVWGKVSGKK